MTQIIILRICTACTQKKGYRNQKYAQKIVDRAIHYCQKNGINRVVLNASDAGKPMYDKLGFVSSPETMRLLIK